METVRDFIFLGSKISADSDHSHKIKRQLLLGRKAMTNVDSILKTRDIILLSNFHLVKAMVFPVVMYRYKSWTIKKVMLLNYSVEKTLESPLAARRSNQSILKEISPEYSLERLMLRLQYLAT